MNTSTVMFKFAQAPCKNMVICHIQLALDILSNITVVIAVLFTNHVKSDAPSYTVL